MFVEVLGKLCKLPTLIILDNVNAEETRKFVLEFVLGIGTSGQRPHFIITSRLKSWNKMSMYVMRLQRLSDADAIELVTNILIDDGSVHNDLPKDIKKLVALMQNLPLTLRQATAHINYQRVEGKFYITDYIDEYNSLKRHYLNSDYFKEEIGFKYNETTYTTWRVTVAAIEKCRTTGSLALRILRIIAYFDFDDIRRDIFFHLMDPSTVNKIDESHVKSAVRRLENYSMIEGRDNQNMLSIHRIVQEVLKIDTSDQKISNEVLQDGLWVLSQMYEQDDFDNTLEHGISVFVSTLNLDCDELVMEYSSFPVDILHNLNKGRKNNRAKAFGDEILQRFTVIFGEDHPNTVRCISNIAWCCNEMGNHTDTFFMLQGAYENRMSTLGEDHPQTINSKLELALSHTELGKHTEALQMFQEAHEKQCNNLGEDHPNSITIISSMADIYFEQGKYSEALRLYENVYARRVNILGDDDTETIESKFNIATVYQGMGKHTEALQIFGEVYEKRKSLLGEDHSESIWTRSNIASLYGDMSKHIEAIKIFEEVYGKQITVFGEDHQETMTTKLLIASSYFDQGKHTEALQRLEELHKQVMEILGEDHSLAIQCKSKIAFSFIELGRHAEALKMFQEIFEKQITNLGENHPDAIIGRYNIALSYRRLGNQSEALKIYQDVYEKQLHILGEDHPDTITTKSTIVDLTKLSNMENNKQSTSDANIVKYYSIEPTFFF